MGQTLNLEVDIRPGAVIFAALGLLLLPIRWLAAILLAGVVHELCHILFMLIQNIRIHNIRVGISGTVIFTESMSTLQELICAAAGPAGSLCLLILLEVYPELALCGLAQGLFNLLPLYPSDGGRILRSGLNLFCPKYADQAVKWAERGTLGMMILSGIILCVLFPRWLWVVLMGASLMLRPLSEKFLAKIALWRYNSHDYVLRGRNNDTVTAENPAGGAKACPIHRR